VHDALWKPGGPIFFYAGNEADVTLYVNHTGLMWESAAQLGALLLFAEHRYWGESCPFSRGATCGDDMQPDNPNAKQKQYLTYEQVLLGPASHARHDHHVAQTPSHARTRPVVLRIAQVLLDFARLIAAFQRQRAIDVPVITFGGSYGAMLSFWLRATYPHAVAGAIVASGPLRVFHGWHLTMVKVAVLPCQAMPCLATILSSGRGLGAVPSLNAMSRCIRSCRQTPDWDSHSYWATITRSANATGGSAPRCSTNVRAAFDELIWMMYPPLHRTSHSGVPPTCRCVPPSTRWWRVAPAPPAAPLSRRPSASAPRRPVAVAVVTGTTRRRGARPLGAAVVVVVATAHPLGVVTPTRPWLAVATRRCARRPTWRGCTS